MSIYCIEDIKAKSIVCVFSSINDQTAERSFIDLLSKTEEDVFNQHPEDFQLIHLIDLNVSDQCVINFEGAPQVVRSGSDYSKPYLEGLRLARQKFLEKLATSRTVGGSDHEE